MSDRVGYWQRMVASLEASGLSRAEYCRRRRLNYHTLTYWVKRLGHSDQGGAGAGLPSFVEVSWPGVAGPAAYEVRLGNGRAIRLGAGFESEALQRLIRTVESC
jgi:hypothetical protein